MPYYPQSRPGPGAAAGSPAGGPARMGDLIEALFRDPALAGYMRLREVRDRWIEIAGPRLAAHSRVMTLDRGVLRIEVDSAPLLSELAGFGRADLLRRLQEALPKKPIRELKFLAGSWRAGGGDAPGRPDAGR
ncbi:MAG: DUF721 domain-containing protein [Planctomycetes bacterium]|nr:DUF721 domain-containing protein [Planctomycetota bacterium]